MGFILAHLFFQAIDGAQLVSTCTVVMDPYFDDFVFIHNVRLGLVI